MPTLTVTNPLGHSVALGEPLAQGGEGCVHPVPSYPLVVVKLYHESVLARRGTLLRPKIEAMAGDPCFAGLKRARHLAWPQFSVFDDSGRWRGYAMRRVEGIRLTSIAHAKAYQAHFPRLDRRALADMLIELVTTVEALHRQHILLGDYNLANFLVSPDHMKLAFIDCDAWQLETAAMSFPCPVAAPDMMPPEHHDQDLSRVKRTAASEAFSLAIVLFKALMLGRHPYDVKGGEDPVSNIRKGYFPYGLGGGGIPAGPWYNIWSHLSYKLKEGFVTTFKEGARDPARRLLPCQWRELLVRYRKELDRGWHDPALIPAAPKSKEYRGRQSLANAG